MKKLIPFFFFIFLAMSAHSQSVIVFDPAVQATLVTCHIAQQEKLEDIKENEASILAAQLVISDQMERIKEIEEILHERLKTVFSIVQDGANIVYASQIAEDIGKYQGDMIEYASENPLLVGIAYEAEAVLITRTANLLTYLATATIPGEINLLDNRQRQEIIEYAVKELRVMLGIAYTVANNMKIASRERDWDHKKIFELDYPDYDQEILEKVISDM